MLFRSTSIPSAIRPRGLVFHSSGPIDGGWGIIDFWESREDFHAFQPRIQGELRRLGW
jgi:hypothetical protein